MPPPSTTDDGFGFATNMPRHIPAVLGSAMTDTIARHTATKSRCLYLFPAPALAETSLRINICREKQ